MNEKDAQKSIVKRLRDRQRQNPKSDEYIQLKEKVIALGKAESEVSKGYKVIEQEIE